MKYLCLIGLTVLIGLGWNADLRQRYRKYRNDREHKAMEERWAREEQEVALWPIYRVMCAHDSVADIYAAISNCPPKHWVVIGPGEWNVEMDSGFMFMQELRPQTGVKGVNAKFSNYDDGREHSCTIGTMWRYGKSPTKP